MAEDKKEELPKLAARGVPSYFNLPESTFKQVQHKYEHLAHENLDMRIPSETTTIKKELKRVGDILASMIPDEIARDEARGKTERPQRYRELYKELTGKEIREIKTKTPKSEG